MSNEMTKHDIHTQLQRFKSLKTLTEKLDRLTGVLHSRMYSYTHAHTHKQQAWWFIGLCTAWKVVASRSYPEREGGQLNRLAGYLISCKYAVVCFYSTLTIRSKYLVQLMNMSLDNRAINYYAPHSWRNTDILLRAIS